MEGGSEGRTFFSFFRFIRSLTNFFKPSCHQFSSIVYSLTNSKRYSSVGLQLIKYLSKMEGVREREGEREGLLYYYYYYYQVCSGLLQSLVKDIVAQLGQVSEYEMNMTLSLSLPLPLPLSLSLSLSSCNSFKGYS